MPDDIKFPEGEDPAEAGKHRETEPDEHAGGIDPHKLPPHQPSGD